MKAAIIGGGLAGLATAISLRNVGIEATVYERSNGYNHYGMGFLMLAEPAPAGGSPDAPRSLNDYEIASRLSYFLWSTMPDNQLFRLAISGELKDPDIYRQQVERMLKDRRSRALVENFAAQWLGPSCQQRLLSSHGAAWHALRQAWPRHPRDSQRAPQLTRHRERR